ncbi:MAG TPA: M3 family metallopeptidase [Candidatus Cybelea sp.]
MQVLAAALAALLTTISFAPASASDNQYRIDLSRYFASAATEAGSRAAVMDDAKAFAASPAPGDANQLLRWLQQYDSLLQSLERHDIFVYLRAEENDQDVGDAKADDALGNAEDLISNRVIDVAQQLGRSRILALTDSRELAPYRYLLTSSLAKTVHRLDAGQRRSVEVAVMPVLATAAASYKALRKSNSTIESRQDAYAALLVSIASARNGVARLRGFDGAAQASYFDKSIDPASVERAQRAVRESGAYAHYLSVAAQAPKPTFSPPRLAVADAIAQILAAEQPMGAQYASAYTALLDPRSARLEICAGSRCDDAGFSVGFAGMESGAYYGGYDGTVRTVRALAHESGHAVHREFMSRNQAIAAYNLGPAFMFESFAIFNELLFLNHLYKSAANDAARAYYLGYFLEDAGFQVFGSAQETDLEAAIYRGVDEGTLSTAADLDALTTNVLSHYDPASTTNAATPLYWARDRLYFTDPLYDVNYLFAGLLALAYFTRFEQDSGDFTTRYVALLKNGFNDSPAALERRFLGIDLTDERALVANAASLIEGRTEVLAKLYSSGGKAP